MQCIKLVSCDPHCCSGTWVHGKYYISVAMVFPAHNCKYTAHGWAVCIGMCLKTHKTTIHASYTSTHVQYWLCRVKIQPENQIHGVCGYSDPIPCRAPVALEHPTGTQKTQFWDLHGWISISPTKKASKLYNNSTDILLNEVTHPDEIRMGRARLVCPPMLLDLATIDVYPRALWPRDLRECCEIAQSDVKSV